MSQESDIKAKIRFLKDDRNRLQDDIRNANRELISIRESHRILEEDCNRIQHEIEQVQEASMKELSEVRESRNIAIQQRDEAVSLLNSVRSQIKDKMKELSKINEWCLISNQENKDLKTRNQIISEEINQREILFQDVKKLEFEKSEIESQLSESRKELAEITNSLDSTIYLSQQSIERNQTELAEIKLQREREEIALHDAREQRLRIERDVEIYVGRARELYKKAFPELEMKL